MNGWIWTSNIIWTGRFEFKDNIITETPPIGRKFKGWSVDSTRDFMAKNYRNFEWIVYSKKMVIH